MKYDVMTPIGGDSGGPASSPKKKTRWQKIGRAWSDSEEKIIIVLDALPFRSEYIYLFKSEDQTVPRRDPARSRFPDPGEDPEG